MLGGVSRVLLVFTNRLNKTDSAIFAFFNVLLLLSKDKNVSSFYAFIKMFSQTAMQTNIVLLLK